VELSKARFSGIGSQALLDLRERRLHISRGLISASFGYPSAHFFFPLAVGGHGADALGQRVIRIEIERLLAQHLRGVPIGIQHSARVLQQSFQ
jgi:hypothetical protein